MPRRRNNKEKNMYAAIEKATMEAKSLFWNKKDILIVRRRVEKLVKGIITAMCQQSNSFKMLYKGQFNGGSIYDDLKVGKPDEFDIFILLELPKNLQPILLRDVIPGYALLQLQNVENLKKLDENVYKDMTIFVDEKNYVTTFAMKMKYLQSIFDKTMDRFFPNGIIKINQFSYEIVKVQKHGVPFTLSVKGFGFPVSIDLVPCLVMDKSQWPAPPSRQNPFNCYKTLTTFFLVPKKPKADHAHLDRYWSISFDQQDRKLMHDRLGMKPAIRILKKIRDHFHHKITSYTIKTMFLWEFDDGGSTTLTTPTIFKSRLGLIIFQMLQKYLECLKNRRNNDFWNKSLNLWGNISDIEFEQYSKDIGDMITDLTTTFWSQKFLTYLE